MPSGILLISLLDETGLGREVPLAKPKVVWGSHDVLVRVCIYAEKIMQTAMFENLKNPMDGRKAITKGTNRYMDWILPEYEGKQIRVEAKCWRHD